MSSLAVYNSLSRRKEPFEPLKPGRVSMYVCGITAYNYFHVGNARAFVAFDVIRRYLKWRGYDVHYVQNFTDIDDKILKRATEEGVPMQEIAERYITAYFEDADRLNIMRADEYPRATHSLDGIQRLIHELEQGGYAYPAGGDVYYAVRQFPEYGKLSGRKLEDMQAGASGRVDVEEEAECKKDPFDFALWKSAKPGEPAWESPWGPGRPGWHIECSAMVRDTLGETIDIHAGGVDLQFPHHENEIAQSEAVTGKPLARYWLHNGFINIDGEKMSKSLGNFRTARDLLASYDPMAFRLFVCQAQYRKPVDFTQEGLDAALSGWRTLESALLFGSRFSKQLDLSENALEADLDSEAVSRFREAMDDDFNTSIALSVLFELAKELNRQGNLLIHQGKTDASTDVLGRQWRTLIDLAKALGLEVRSTSEIPTGEISATAGPATAGIAGRPLSNSEIESLIGQRAAARKARNFAEADRIRQELAAQGVLLTDQPDGTTLWHWQDS
ncbi:cysteine--tRNA ligase [Leptolyngbya sp. FACHB-261]|uniref:cysteine--tRNA ligase n=1 Tax=Leptolyngbya sp. FACHB-261 TaxID=2692806 RepID=UPI0016828623|nr:cysteine--tRNA ligase [Leptolyngbya sp. FACHB-261]MBD2102000.1 cysteine--tRNA ligase [Leptolyngbya sp. FACHB-261]